MESPSVRSKIGAHITDCCNNPESILRDAINESLDTGLLRLELTIYTYDCSKPLMEDYINARMDYLQSLMDPKLIYYNPIKQQFDLLCECVLYNVCIVDVESNLAFVALYNNTLTGKVNGFYVKNCSGGKLANVLKHYCSNKPIYVVLMSIDRNNSTVSIQQDMYVRISTRGPLVTYLNKGSEYLKGYNCKDAAKQPNEAGLEPNNVFNFAISKTTISLQRVTDRVPVKFRSIQLPSLDYPNNKNTLRTINRTVREESNDTNFRVVHKDKIESVMELNATIEKKVKVAQYEEMVRTKLYDRLEAYRTYAKKFLEYPDGTLVYCYAFKILETQYGPAVLLACSEDSSITERTKLHMVWGVSNVAKSLIANEKMFKKINVGYTVAYGSISGEPIITLQKTGTYHNNSRNLCASVKIVGQNESASEQDKAKDTLMYEMSSYVKAGSCKCIDDIVKEGDIVTIYGYRQLRNSMLLAVRINGKVKEKYNTINDINVKGSYWIKEIVQKHIAAGQNTLDSDNIHISRKNSIINVVAGAYKTTPTKHKNRVYTLST